MKQDKSEKIIQRAEKKAAKSAQKAAKQVEAANKKAETARQKQLARAAKKADMVAKKAEKITAKHNKRAEKAQKKAQLAAKKAEERKAKAAVKVASKAAEGEGGEDPGKKKGGKKKLLLLLIPVLAAAIGGGVWFFFLRGGEKEEAPPEPIPIPVEYVLNEVPITALPVNGEEVLVYQEEIVPPPEEEAPPEDDASKEEDQDAGSKEEDQEAESEDQDAEKAEEPPAEEEKEPFTKILYRYEGLKNPVSLISAYTAVMTTEDAGFSVVDETLLRTDPPAEYGASGSVQLARNVPTAEDGTGGGVHSLLLSWEEGKCSVILDMPEGRVRDPKPETAPTPTAPTRGLPDLEAIHPSKLGLPGDSMEEYRLIPQEGSVRIAGSVCMRVNVYGDGGQIAGSYFLSQDGKLYQLDETANAVVELDWE